MPTLRHKTKLPSVLVISVLNEDSQLSIEKEGSRTEIGLGCRQLSNCDSISSICKHEIKTNSTWKKTIRNMPSISKKTVLDYSIQLVLSLVLLQPVPLITFYFNYPKLVLHYCIIKVTHLYMI